DAGKLQFRDDIYGLDSKLMSILWGSDSAVADIAIERPADPNFKPTAEEGNRLRSMARGSGNVPGPFGLFEQLFPSWLPEFIISVQGVVFHRPFRWREAPGFNRLFFAILGN